MGDSNDITDDDSTAVTTAMTDTGTHVEDVQPCRLLELPAELRTAIFSLVLVHHDTITVALEQAKGSPQRPGRAPAHHFWYEKMPDLGLSPDLLITCRQINSEATPILYGRNCLAFSRNLQISVLSYFLEATGNSARLLCDVELGGERNRKERNAALVALKRLGPKLRKISFRPHFWMRFSTHEMVLAVRPLTRALDKQWKADTERKTTDILDKLQFHAHEYDLGAGQSLTYSQHEENEKAEKYSVEIKDTLRRMLFK